MYIYTYSFRNIFAHRITFLLLNILKTCILHCILHIRHIFKINVFVFLQFVCMINHMPHDFHYFNIKNELKEKVVSSAKNIFNQFIYLFINASCFGDLKWDFMK